MQRLLVAGCFGLVALGFAACGSSGGPSGGGGGGGGGASGLDGDRALGSLDDADLKQLCEYVVEVGPTEPADCGGFTYEPTTVSECVMDAFPETCEATVAQAEACAETIGEDPCSAAESQACDWIFDCKG